MAVEIDFNDPRLYTDTVLPQLKGLSLVDTKCQVWKCDEEATNFYYLKTMSGNLVAVCAKHNVAFRPLITCHNKQIRFFLAGEDVSYGLRDKECLVDECTNPVVDEYNLGLLTHTNVYICQKHKKKFEFIIDNMIGSITRYAGHTRFMDPKDIRAYDHMMKNLPSNFDGWAKREYKKKDKING